MLALRFLLSLLPRAARSTRTRGEDLAKEIAIDTVPLCAMAGAKGYFLA